MDIREPIKEEGQLICPHDNQALVPVGGNGKPRSLECSCGYVWYLGAKIEISEGRIYSPAPQSRRLLPETRERIKKMLDEGKDRKVVAELCGVQLSVVDYYKARAGLTEKNPRVPVERKNKVIELIKQKMTNKAISKKMGIPINAVFYIRSCARATGELS